MRPLIFINQKYYNMLFRDAKQGHVVYVLDRKEIKITSGKITNTPMPHFDNNNFTGKMVVDVNVDIDGKMVQYVLDDTSEVGYVGDMVVSVNIDAILREVERIENQSEEALKMVDYHKDAVVKCKQLRKEYSQEYKDRTEATERMDSMEKQLAQISEMLRSLTINNQN